MATVPKSHVEFVAAAFRSIFALSDNKEIEARWDEVTATLAERFPKAAESMTSARTDVLTFATFPRSHRRKIWSNNPVRHEAPHDRVEVKGLHLRVVAAA